MNYPFFRVFCDIHAMLFTKRKMNRILYISQANSPVALPFDRVKQFVVITAIETDQKFGELIDQGFQLFVIKKNADGEEENQRATVDGRSGESESSVEVYIPLNMDGVVSASIEARLYEGQDLQSPIKLYYQRINKLPMEIPDAGFSAHLGDLRNHKILFSGKFGQGKSTFLDYYFNARKDQYNVFRLFPVNYSVASNEDVFRYIKCELIFQLLERNVVLDLSTKEHSSALIDFAKKNIHSIISPLLLLAPKVGRSLYKMYEKYEELTKEYMVYYESLQADSKLLAEGYLDNFFQEEGGVFEDDFYTKLIRHQLQKLKTEDESKENILVIDDLDRMDPDHIFRILNVFSAHYDQFHIYGDDHGNKFGFDRIILVCDYENVRNIYEYRYGKKVDFTGYINKYYSTEKFDFNNKIVVKGILKDIDRYGQKGVLTRPDYRFFNDLTIAMFNAGCLSLRDIINLQNIGMKSVFSEVQKLGDSSETWLTSSEFIAPVILLSKIGSFETLKKNLLDIRGKDFETKVDWTNKSILLLGCLPGGKESVVKVLYKKQMDHYLEASFVTESGFMEVSGSVVWDRSNSSNNTYRPNYNFEEFKELFILLIEKLHFKTTNN